MRLTKTRRNRKKRVQANVVPRRLVSVLVLMAVFALAYLLIDTMCRGISESIRTLESEQEDIAFKLRREQNRWSLMTSGDQIELALNRHGLDMALPRGEQVVRLDAASGGVYRPRDQFANR